MVSAITDARIITPHETIERGTIVVADNGRIDAVGPDVSIPASASTTPADGLTIVPGFIDLHVHGGGGFSLVTEDPLQIESYARWVTRFGVTSFVPTIFGADLEEALRFVRTAAGRSGDIPEGAALLGLNLEGPFVNADRRGALPQGWVTDADQRSFDGLVQAAAGSLRLLTLAPELPRTEEICRSARSQGMVVAIGHTNADFDTALRAFETGASHVTHAFNAMRPFHHRDPGPVGAAIESPQVTIEVIADGVHLHPATVSMLIRAAGAERIALVTDAVPPAGLSAGSFRVGADEARLQGGRITLGDGTIAGSATTMDELVRNVVDWGITGLAGAALMASTVPARVIGLAASKGRLVPGFDADLVALDRDLAVAMTWVGGRVVYRRGES